MKCIPPPSFTFLKVFFILFPFLNFSKDISSPVLSSSAYVINELEGRLKAKIRENEELKQKVENYENQLNNILATQAPVKLEEFSELNEIKKEFDDLRQQLESSRNELDIRNNDLDVTLRELEIRTKEAEIMRKDLDTKKNDLESKSKELELKTKELDLSRKERELLEKELDVLRTEKGRFKEDLEESVEHIRDNQQKVVVLLEENEKLNKICQENLTTIKMLKEEKNQLTKTCQEFEGTKEKILRDTERFEKKIDEIGNNYDNLTEKFLLVCAENERIHEILEGYTPPENDPSTTLYVGKLENDKLILENEVEKWKLEYTNLQYLMKTNEELIRKNQELNNTVNNLYFSQSIDEEKYRKVVAELVEKIKFLSMENERLNNIILNRCKDMMNNW